MSIPDHARCNFQTLLRAAADGNLALMECIEAKTGTQRYVICAIGRDSGDYVFTPFGHLADDNPYDAYLPPDPDDPGGRSAIIVERASAFHPIVKAPRLAAGRFFHARLRE